MVLLLNLNKSVNHISLAGIAPQQYVVIQSTRHVSFRGPCSVTCSENEDDGMVDSGILYSEIVAGNETVETQNL